MVAPSSGTYPERPVVRRPPIFAGAGAVSVSSASVAGMSEQTPQADDQQEWPENCPQCGTRLQSVAVDFAADSADEVGATADVAEAVFVDRCPDPECPANRDANETAPATTDGSLGDRQPDEPTLPGSLGGDNGGA